MSNFTFHESSSQNSHETVASGSFFFTINFHFCSGYIILGTFLHISCSNTAAGFLTSVRLNYWRKMWHLSCLVTYKLCLADLYYVDVFVLNAFLIHSRAFSYFTILQNAGNVILFLLLNTRDSLRSISLMTDWIEFQEHKPWNFLKKLAAMHFWVSCRCCDSA